MEKEKKLSELKTLVLNADYRPICEHPLSTKNFKQVINALIKKRVRVVEEYKDAVIHLPEGDTFFPSVICLNKYVNIDRKPRFSRFNVYLRDNFTCQYCGKHFDAKDLTFDHIVPRCKGGKTTWENVTTACRTCNGKKGSKLLSECKDMQLIKAPFVPSNHLLSKNSKNYPKGFLHDSWRDYLYWEEEIE